MENFDIFEFVDIWSEKYFEYVFIQILLISVYY